MKIKTKFDIRQEVYVFDWQERLRLGKICEIQTNYATYNKKPLITYMVAFEGYYGEDEQEEDYYQEHEIFATKSEAEQALKRLEGKDE